MVKQQEAKAYPENYQGAVINRVKKLLKKPVLESSFGR